MGKVIAQAMMSLDGYIAKDDNTIGRLFDWLQNGEVERVSPRGDMTLHLTPQSAEHWRRGSRASACWSAGGPSSTSPTAGTAGTTSTSRSSW